MTHAAWQQHSRSVYRYLRRRLSSQALAEDLRQETFLRLHAASLQALEPVAMRAWLLRTAHNLLVDHYRAQRNELELDESQVAEVDGGAALRSLEPCIAPLAERLPEHYRTALLWDIDGVAQQEIAQRQQLTLSGAKSRVQRARRLLKEEFERCCRYHFDHAEVLVGFSPRAGALACRGNEPARTCAAPQSE